MNAEAIIAFGQIVQAIATVGLPAVRKIVEQLEKNGDPTLEDIAAITDMMKQPEEYFK
jgi:hypothetical protein